MSGKTQAKRLRAAPHVKPQQAYFEVHKVVIQPHVTQYDAKTGKVTLDNPSEPEVVHEAEFFPGLQDWITQYLAKRQVVARNFAAVPQKDTETG